MHFSFETIPTFVWVFIAIYIVHWINKPRLSKNEPPMVSYKIPIIGHTLDYLFNAENFLAKCRQQYGDPFNIYVFGQVTTIAGNEFAHEVYRSDVFSKESASQDSFPLHRVLKILEYPETSDQFIKTVREQFVAKLPLYTGRMQKQLMISINKEIGDCSNPKLIITTNGIFSSIIARPIADTLVGQEISKNEDVVKAFADFTKDFISILRHVITLKKHLKPVLEKRLKDKEILGDKYEPPLDTIEYLLNDPEYGTKVITDDYLNKICEFVYVIVVASIFTSAHHIAFALYDFAGRPELWDDIYEEQERIDKECNGELSPQHINKMVKLDSFVRESLRTGGSALMHIPHKCLESYTCKNGMTIPKGRMVKTYLKDIHYNATAYGPEPRSFLPYHGLENKFPATKIDKNYFVFGSGKHACPGRFFAVNEIKIGMHKLILNYHIKTPSGKIEKKVHLGPLTLPPVAGLIFENRKK
ncbi:568_t:CDS:10 [Diversispora eburnea]|uniref:568_t:CDS:1 n=1 Tax=Diversispora eburnea TaxID=1213867 RepID=A0A9N9B7I7_9GLOM|nr:568_t:CDS:10 [Diversispora eburnea]